MNRIHAFAATGAARRFTRLAVASALALSGLSLVAPAQAAGEPVVVSSLPGAGNGAQPYGTMVQGPDGYFYGTALTNSPDSGWGGLFRMKANGGYKWVHAFDGATEGGSPRGDLMVGQDGAIYGNASTGEGSAEFGSLWKYVPGGKFKLLHLFNGADGAYPGAALVQDSKGVLYGVTAGGGEFGRGVVFKMQPNGNKIQVLHSFAGDAAGGAPRGLTLGSDGLLYGVTAGGGSTGEGVTFKLARDGSGYQALHSFDSSAGDSVNAQANVVFNAADGYVYGTTNSNGNDYGSVYRFNAAGDFKVVMKFDDITNGEFPTAPLVIGPNGHLYGTAPYGGPSRSYGTLFELDPASGKLVGVVSLTEAAYSPQAGLTVGTDGMLYTPTYAGGTSSAGAVIKVDPAAFPAPVLPKPLATIYFNQIYPPMTTSNTTVGKRMDLHWVSQYADSCVFTGTWSSGTLAPEGHRVIKQDAVGDYPYTLTCTNAQGSTSTTSFLHVLP